MKSPHPAFLSKLCLYYLTNDVTPDYYKQCMDIIQHQTEHFEEVCINDLLALYSRYTISRGLAKKQQQHQPHQQHPGYPIHPHGFS